jgi:hypothetical protein
MQIEDLLRVAEKINHGIWDRETTDSRFRPLWRYPFLLETFISALQASPHHDDYRRNFETVCSLLCPDFLPVLRIFE